MQVQAGDAVASIGMMGQPSAQMVNPYIPGPAPSGTSGSLPSSPTMQMQMPTPQTGIVHAASLQWGASTAPFSTGVCDCCDNCESCICCKGLFCPCCLFGDINEYLNGERGECGHCILCCLLPCTFGACCMGSANRGQIRKKFGLKGTSGDCCTHCCCHVCAMCQEMREINFRTEALATSHSMMRPQAVAAPNQQFMTMEASQH